MGLGKSLQSVALMLTVLRQGMKGTPTARYDDTPAPCTDACARLLITTHMLLCGLVPRQNRRILVVCPTSLVSNWDKEITKWVGARIKTIPIAEATRDKVGVHGCLYCIQYPVPSSICRNRIRF